MPTPPLYVCPDCEPGPYAYAGEIIAKLCSVCAAARADGVRSSEDRA